MNSRLVIFFKLMAFSTCAPATAPETHVCILIYRQVRRAIALVLAFPQNAKNKFEFKIADIHTNLIITNKNIA